MGQFRRSLADYNTFKKLSLSEKQEQSVELIMSEDKHFQFFIDSPRLQSGPRLNIVGHGDRGGQTFQGDIPGAQMLTHKELAELIVPLIRKSGAKTVRLVSCRSGATGFARALANEIRLPVKAPIGTVTIYEVMTGRFWLLKRTYINKKFPEDHLFHWYFPER